ncbi:DUF2169 domain-containing protein [soil metagenome]
MLQVDNRTPFNAALAVFANPRGVETAYIAIKAAFDITPSGLEPTFKPIPLLPGDVYWGDPATTGIRAAGELTLSKPATDIVVLGHAIAPRDGTRAMAISMRIGPVASALRVWGERRWQREGGSWRATDPQAFERVPLRWELAFGGFEKAADGEAVQEFEPRNPAGCGFIGRKDRHIEGRALPQIEHPEQLIQSPEDRPAPAGWAPIAPSWSPRREFAGTYDDAWQTGRAPYLPTDFDPRFLNTAPPGLVAPGFMTGGEAVAIQGCRPGGQPLAFELPVCTMSTVFRFRGQDIDITPKLDSVIIEPDHPRVQLVYRAELAVDKHLLKLGEVCVDCVEYHKPAYLGAVVRRRE